MAKRQEDLKDPAVRTRIEGYLTEQVISWHYGPMWTTDGAWMAYVCLTFGTNGARGLTDCEWIVPGTARSDAE